MKIIKLLFALTVLFPAFTFSQNFLKNSEVHGSFQFDGQYYIADSAIGTPKVPEKTGINAYGNIIYTNNNFSAGIRFETFLPALQGFDRRMNGSGIPYRYASYKIKNLDITLGNFYEQFGNGLIFRSYEDWNLGYDNSLDGLKVKYSIGNGIFLKGIIGKQRKYWEKSPGIVRGFDAEFCINDIFGKLAERKTKVIVGGSFVSKFQSDDPTFKYKLPENVAAFAGRLNVSRGWFGLNGEYAYKINDPAKYNKYANNTGCNYIYRPGQALYINTSYSMKGFSVQLAAKRIDNMAFKSDRYVSDNGLDINFLPPLTRQHTYNLSAMYPYATQPNGEIGFEGQVIYRIKKGSRLGGKYGTDITINFSQINDIKRNQVNDSTLIGAEGTFGYNSPFFAIGKERFFSDLNIEISRKFTRNFKMILSYVYISYNHEVIGGEQTKDGKKTVNAHIGIADMTYKINDVYALRLELQALTSFQDEGSWVMALLEYTIAPKWFFSVGDQYNYKTETYEKSLHYYIANIGYIHDATRISITYGRQRSGVVCTGGVCRAVPASNGISLSITSSF